MGGDTGLQIVKRLPFVANDDLGPGQDGLGEVVIGIFGGLGADLGQQARPLVGRRTKTGRGIP